MEVVYTSTGWQGVVGAGRCSGCEVAGAWAGAPPDVDCADLECMRLPGY